MADYFGKKALELFEKLLEKCVLQTEKTSKENNQKKILVKKGSLKGDLTPICRKSEAVKEMY
mgnify:CR=1 FL=1